MTDRKGKSRTIDVKALLAGDEKFLRALVRTALQEVLEVEMTQALGAENAVKDFYDEDELRRVYYLEAERLVAEATGASRVLVFDHTIRRRVVGASIAHRGRRASR